jgi:hypothetical protein
VKAAKTFFWFGAAAVALDLTMTFVPGLMALQKSVVPLTGWVGSAPYIFALGMWPGLIDCARPRMTGPELRRHLRFTACLLFFYAAYGAFMFIDSGGADHAINPWLRVSVWQPAWTVLVPAVWAVVLFRADVPSGAPAPNVGSGAEPGIRL